MRTQIIILILLLLSACAPATLVPPAEATQDSPAVDLPAAPILTADVAVDEITEAAIADLSARLSSDPKLVRVLSAESRLWPDTSLGCPSPGKLYAQHTVPGYQLQLEVNGQEYSYHTDNGDTVILCQEDDLPSFPITPGEIDDGQPWVPVN
jgi:hypothetical protein